MNQKGAKTRVGVREKTRLPKKHLGGGEEPGRLRGVVSAQEKTRFHLLKKEKAFPQDDDSRGG